MPRSRLAPSPITHHPSLSGLSNSVLARLAKLGITTQFDLVLHLPLRYDDETRLYALNQAPAGEPVLVEGTVVKADVKYRPRRQLLCHIEDGTGVLTLRFFNFYPSQLKQLAAGARLRAFGEIRHGFHGPEMVHPKYRLLQGDAPVAQSLTPVYPTTAGLGQEVLRRLIARALAESSLEDTLPPVLIEKLKLPLFRDAVLLLHNPSPQVAQDVLQERRHPAWRRVKFDELLAQQLSMRFAYRRRRARQAPVLKINGPLLKAFLERLPFRLTKAQTRAMNEVLRDLGEPHPMQRLLQGDVGSGKTVVAAIACLAAVDSGAQAAVMAPTEILSEQHWRKFNEWLAPLGVRLGYLRGGMRKKEKSERDVEHSNSEFEARIRVQEYRLADG